MAGMEEPVEEPLEINTPEGTIKIKIGGTIDRMDCKEDTLRIVDYKTGGSRANFADTVAVSRHICNNRCLENLPVCICAAR